MTDKQKPETQAPQGEGVRCLREDEYDAVQGGGGSLVTTLALGEEDGGWATTMAVGEEDPWNHLPIPLDINIHLGAGYKG